jgi:hypothetical protein
MTLQPGCRFVVAPHFQLLADWPQRLQIGAGVEEVDGSFIPRPSWRRPTTDELAILLRTSAEPMSPEEQDTCACLFQLPRHLQSVWWHLLERAAGVLGDGRLPGFEAFVCQLTEYLAFKGFPVPEGACCDAVVSKPGQPLVHGGPDAKRPLGLPGRPAPWAPGAGAEELGCQQLWAVINLGDEHTSVVLVNLPYRHLEMELRRRFPDQPSPAAFGELVAQFLRSCPDYPMVRLILGPAEGCRLPRGGGIWVDPFADEQETNVVLLISQGRTPFDLMPKRPVQVHSQP